MKKLYMATLFLFIAGCGSIYQPDAVGAGYEPEELKLSPCACIQVETDKVNANASIWEIFG